MMPNCIPVGFVRPRRPAYLSGVAKISLLPRMFSPLRLGAILSCSVIVELSTLAIPGCSSHNAIYCVTGDCCQGLADCPQSCGDGCNLLCSQTAHSCTSTCGNQCNSTCNDTNDCSLSCANNCNLDCHSTASCAGDCGANCNYSCRDTSRCDVRAGLASTITCNNVATCRIQCLGACTVNYNSVDDLEVTCTTGVQSTKGTGTITCG